MGDKRVFIDDDGKFYYIEDGEVFYVESDGISDKPRRIGVHPTVKAALIAGLCALIAALIGAIPFGSSEQPFACQISDSFLINTIYNCGGRIEIAVAATLTANAPTPNPVETSVVETLTAIAPTPTLVEPTMRVNTSTPEPQATSTNTPISLTPFCAFLTLSQVTSLQQIQDSADAIRQAEEYAGFRQNDYEVGDTIPENVVIATNIYTTNFESVGVIPINNSGGYGLFLTTQEIVASYPGTYWCVRDNTPVVSPTPVLQDNCNLESPVTPFNSTEIIPDWRNSETTELNINIPDGYDTLYVSSDPAIFNGFQARERLIILSQSDIVVEGLTFNPGDGHFNIWAVAFSNCSIEAIFERYGLDGTNLAWFIDSGGRQTQYYP